MKILIGLVERHGRPGRSSRNISNPNARDLTSALHRIKLKKNTNLLKTLSNISAVEVRFKKTLNEGRKIEVMRDAHEMTMYNSMS